jgi:hypothetical protein
MPTKAQNNMKYLIIICLTYFELKNSCFGQKIFDSVDIKSYFLNSIPLDSPYSPISWQTEDFTTDMFKEFKFHKRFIGKEYISRIDTVRMLNGITLFNVEMYGRKRKKWGNRLVLLYFFATIRFEDADKLATLFKIKFGEKLLYPIEKPVFSLSLLKYQNKAIFLIKNSGRVYKLW